MVQLEVLQIPSLKLIAGLIVFIARRLWRSFFMCFGIFGTICILYTLNQDAGDMQDENYDQLYINIHESKDQNFMNLNKISNNEMIVDPNVVQDHKQNLRNLIPENHMENDQNNEKDHEILMNKQIHKELKIAANLHANATNTTNSNKYSV